jgi:hypothetical protein
MDDIGVVARSAGVSWVAVITGPEGIGDGEIATEVAGGVDVVALVA